MQRLNGSDEQEGENAMTKLHSFIGGFVTAVLGSMLSGYALSVMWSWFMVPTFGLPNLSIPAALGLCLVVRYMTMERRKTKEDGEKLKPGERTAESFAIPLLFLGVGWVIQQWM